MILARLNLLPPFLCRFIARKRVQSEGRKRLEPMTHSDIAQRSNLPRSTVGDLSHRTSWEGVSIEVADRFATACGVDLTKPGRYIRWLRTGRFKHLTGNAHQRRFLARLMSTQRNVH
jgi:hypothetical protein